jgi:hypothetical protein
MGYESLDPYQIQECPILGSLFVKYENIYNISETNITTLQLNLTPTHPGLVEVKLLGPMRETTAALIWSMAACPMLCHLRWLTLFQACGGTGEGLVTGSHGTS